MNINDAFWQVGIYSPIFIAIILVLHLIRQPKYAIAYVLFSAINVSFNIFLKHTLKQPRPHILVYDKTYDDYYGMPSGHAQQILFTLVFLLLVRPSWIVFWICLTLGSFGLIERYVHRRHTIEQLFVGGVVGGAFAVVSVFGIRKMLFANQTFVHDIQS
jgi:membrane-associated phospholipid phosphatase